VSAFRGLGRRRVLIDSSAYFALANGRDAGHRDARSIAGRLASERWQVFTTNFVVAETHGLILARQNGYQAARILIEIDGSVDTTLVRVARVDERRAREIIYRYADKDFSLTDAISFAIMERLRIGYVFTFDRHFAQYGFAVLTADERG